MVALSISVSARPFSEGAHTRCVGSPCVFVVLFVFAPAVAICVLVLDPVVVDDGDVAISVDLTSLCACTDRTRAKATVRAIADRRACSLKERGAWFKPIQPHVNS